MQRVKELINVLNDEDVIARTAVSQASHTCKICQGSALHFRDSRAELEYSISSICQKCQDYFFSYEN